jgi:integrase
MNTNTSGPQSGPQKSKRKHGEATVYWDEEKGAWYYRVQVDGKRYKRSTEIRAKSDRKAAERKAKELSRAILEKDQVALDAMVARPGFSTVGELLDRWEKAGPIKSAPAVSGRFERFVAAALQTTTPREEKLDRALDGEVFRKWTQAAAAAGRGEDGIRSDVNSIKSVLQPSVLYAYADLKLPPVEAFRSVVFSTRRRESKGAVKRAAFVCIPPDVLARMEAAAEVLRTSEALKDRQVWAVFALMRWCGLRNHETIDLRWDWIRQGKKSMVLEFTTRDLGKGKFYYPKGRAGAVPIRADLLEQLRKAFPDDGEHVITRKYETDAKKICQRGINRFVEKFLSRRGKKLSYNLRMQFGAEVAMRDGLEVASRMLRHASTQTTWAYYHDLVTEPEPL